MTNRQLISNLNNKLRALNIDDYISPRYLLYIAIDVTGDFLKKQSDRARLMRETEGWTEIENIPMISVPISECGLDTTICTSLMRTKIVLPETFTGAFGNIIKHVSSLNFGTVYELTTPKEWRNIQKREFKGGVKYYFWINGYLYIPNSEVENIRVEAFFKYKWEAEIINQKNCPDCNTSCIKPLNSIFVCPENLINDVIKETVLQVANSLQIPQDSLNNLNPNIKVKPNN